MKPQPQLGRRADYAGAVLIDVPRLIETRLVVTAISGGGKSHAIRRILEQTHGQVQQIVIDPEGEFYTLREKFGYVLAGRNGDCPVDVKSAAMLAIRLLELRVSAIVDLYSLSADPRNPNNRAHFVKVFLDSLLNADQRLFHPCLVVIDEAHKFCPEKGEGESLAAGAVINLMADGRKKQICGILATQRLSKLDKSAASEAHNMMIGKSTLDVDVARAMKNLGFRQGHEIAIRKLQRGHFWTYGPALSDDVIEVLVADTVTKSPKIGAKMTVPAAPSAEISKVLSRLVDLPAEAERKEKTEKELRAEIADLKKQLKEKPTECKTLVEKIPVLEDGELHRIEKAAKSLDASVDEIKEALDRTTIEISAAGGPIGQFLQRLEAGRQWFKGKPGNTLKVKEQPAVRTRVNAGAEPDKDLPPSFRRILIALAQNPKGVSNVKQLAAFSGYSVNGHFNNMLGALRTKEYISPARVQPIQVTNTGLTALGEYEPLPEGAALREYWMNRVGPSRAKILGVLFANRIYTGFSVAELAHASGYAVNGHFNNMLGSLRTLGLVTPPRQPIKAMDYLLE